MLPPNIVRIGENYFQRDIDLGIYPIFSYELNRRVKNMEACVTIVVGEAGTGKSYTAIQLARNIDKRFSIDQIVFTYSDYCKELAVKHPGIPMVFDEPSYAMGKREWYKEINQALVKTIESQRFLVRPLIIPIININLLDKTLRDYLVQFQVHMTKRGHALVYRMRASQGEDKMYRYLITRLDYPIIDFDKCSISTCLDCDKRSTCMLLRAQYERKKMAIQLSRYEQDEEKARERETKEFTDDQLLDMIKTYETQYMEKDAVNQRKLRVLFKEMLSIKVSNNKAYQLKALIEYRMNPNNKKPV